MPLRFLLLLVLVVNFIFANDEQIIYSSAPEGMKLLSVNLKEHKNVKEYKGRHGLKEYCYSSNNVFITYSYNLLGHGYILSNENEEKRTCTKSNKITAKNAMGISLNMEKEKIENLLGIKIKSTSQDIIWQFKAEINGLEFDVQTYARFKFINDRLSYLSVFTTETH